MLTLLLRYEPFDAREMHFDSILTVLNKFEFIIELLLPTLLNFLASLVVQFTRPEPMQLIPFPLLRHLASMLHDKPVPVLCIEILDHFELLRCGLDFF